MRRLSNKDLFKLHLVEGPGVLNSWEYKDENGAWIVKIEDRGVQSDWRQEVLMVIWSDSFCIEIRC
jgi:hypothetical protein